MWKHIRKGWDKFSQFIKFEVGDGSTIKFWADFWCGTGPLKQTYPELFRLAWNKDAFIGDYMEHRNGSFHWQLQLTRSLQDWEVESISSFLDLLYSTHVKGTGRDTLLWGPSGKQTFSVQILSRSTTLGGCGISLESYLETKGSTKSFFLSLDSIFGKNFKGG